MNEKSLKSSFQRIINISNIYNIKQNSFNDNYTYIKSMNNSISSQKLITQNSTCSSYLKSNKTFSNEENLITDIKPYRREANKSLLKNLCVSNFSINSDQKTFNLKNLVYKKKQVNNPSFKFNNNINTIRNRREKNKKINLINEEFTRKINKKERKHFTDLTLDEYLKKEIKYINKKYYNENNNIKENQNENEKANTYNNKENNNITNNNQNKSSNKSLLNNYITYNNFKNESKDKLKQNKIKQKLCSKICYINLPHPKRKDSKNKIISSLNNKINSNKTNKNKIPNHRKYNSFDSSMKDIFKKERNSQNMNDGKKSKIKIINLEINLNELMTDNNKKDVPKKTFRFSKSSKKLSDNININNFAKDFFIFIKLKIF